MSRAVAVAAALEAEPDRADALLEEPGLDDEARGLTGVLVYHQGCFIQAIEGPRDAMEVLYRSVVEDPRHGLVERLARGPVERADFATWAMGRYSLVGSCELDEGVPRGRLAQVDALAPRGAWEVLRVFRDLLGVLETIPGL